MEQIGRYRIVGELGRGAMGVVYRAQDPTIGRTVAIKTIRLAEVTDPRERERLRERLFREAQSAGALSHPNIVTIYDVAEENGLAYIAMEYVNGSTLDRLLATEKLPDGAQLLEILGHTAAALDYAHDHGIVHRDIKPANIMIDETGTAKIADFGVAKILSQQMTQAAGIIGTPSYMSPEQVEGAPLDGRADQFALGVIAYEVLTGDKPFVGDPLPTLLYKIVQEEPLAPQRLNPTLGWQVETVLKRVLAKDPAKRYPTCTEFVRALGGACAAKKGWKPMAPGNSQNIATIAATEPNLSPSRRISARREESEPAGTGKRTAAILALLALLGIAAFAGYRYFQATETAPTEVAQNQAPTEPKVEPPAQPPVESTPPPKPPVSEEPKDAPALKEAPEAKPEETNVDPAKPTGSPELRAPEKPPVPRREPPPPDTGQEQMVELRSNPPGAIVIVDGKARSACRTPCTVPLAPGKHNLGASLSGHRPTFRSFDTPTDKPITVEMEIGAGVVYVQSTPPGASIVVNGQPRSEKTPAVIKLAAGKHKLQVSLEGSTSEQDIEVRDGGRDIYNFDFRGQK
jgi:serine/threonine-protein kinase